MLVVDQWRNTATTLHKLAPAPVYRRHRRQPRRLTWWNGGKVASSAADGPLVTRSGIRQHHHCQRTPKSCWASAKPSSDHFYPWAPAAACWAISNNDITFNNR